MPKGMTDESAAALAISTLTPLSPTQQLAQSQLTTLLASDPFPDVHSLLALYNTLYFRSLLLPAVEISWSTRLTLCAGTCELARDPANNNRYTRVRLKLSEPLLKFRPRVDLLDTLLHEAIHAYLFLTTSWRHSRGDDGTGHGEGFLMLADAVNEHGGYGVSVYHSFHDEVESYRTHVWECEGPCQARAPFFGLVKRAMNRAPGKGDAWWARHEEECGGVFRKIAEPEMTREQVQRLSGLQRAGRQKNKIDGWVGGRKRERSLKRAEPDEAEVSVGRGDGSEGQSRKRERTSVCCPICGEEMAEDRINQHLDDTHE